MAKGNSRSLSQNNDNDASGIQGNAPKNRGIDLTAAAAVKSKIRTAKTAFDLVIAAVNGQSPSELLYTIEKTIYESREPITAFGARTLNHYAVIFFDAADAREALVTFLVDKSVITREQIADSIEDALGDRFVVIWLDPARFKVPKDGVELQTAMLRFLENNKEGVDFSNGRLKITDVDDGNAIAMVNDTECSNYLLNKPNVFVGLHRAAVVYYPESDFCTTCCSLEHKEADCVHGDNPKCFECGGPHLGANCSPVQRNCPNCRSVKKFSGRTHHSAKSALCKSRIDSSLKLLNIDL